MSSRLSQGELQRQLEALLRTDAVHHVSIIDPITYGSPDEVPEGLDLNGHEPILSMDALALVTEEDRAVVFNQVLKADPIGTTTDPVRLSNGMTADATLFDLIERYGYWVTVTTELYETADSVDELPKRDLQARVTRYRVDSLGKPIEMDSSAMSMLGWNSHTVTERGPLGMIHPEDRHPLMTAWGGMLTRDGSSDRSRTRVRHADGTYRWVEVTLENHLATDGSIHVEMLDIAREMEALDRIRANERLLHRLAEALPVGVVQIDGDQNVVYANGAMHRITGRDIAATFAEQMQDALEEDRVRTEQAVAQVLGTGVDGDLEVTVEQKGTGIRRICGMTIRALVEDDGTTTGAIVCVTDVTDSASRRHELEVAATFDPLTGAYNRASCLAALDAALSRPSFADAGCAVVFVDLDGFKIVNDAHGHIAGDELLVETAERLRAVTRSSDVVGRYGGDEFIVVCPEVADPATAYALAQRIDERLRQAVTIDGSTIEPRASVGVAWSPVDDASVTALVARADAAMYHAKRNELGRAHLWNEATGLATEQRHA